VEGNKFAFQLSGSNGILQYFSGVGVGGGIWKTTTFTIPVNASRQALDWIRLVVRLNFTAKTCDLYAAVNATTTPQMVAADIPFFSNISTHLSSFQMQGVTDAASSLDDIYAGPINPIFTDVNSNGINDAWENSYGVSSYSRNYSPTTNGVSIVQAYISGTNPNDWYNSVTPTLVMVGGDNQTAFVGQFNAMPFDVGVYNSGTTPYVNAPVTVTVTPGGGKLAMSRTDIPTSTLSPQFTDQDGTVRVYYQQPATPGQSTITFTAGTASMMFTTLSIAATDSNGDGIPELWATVYGLDPYDAAMANALFIGRPAGDMTMTNLQAYLSGNYPLVLALQNAPMPTSGGYQVIVVTPGNRIYGINGSYQINPLPISAP